MKAKSWKSFVPKTPPAEQSGEAMDSLRTLFQSGDGSRTGGSDDDLKALLGEDSEILSLMAERERLEQNMQSASGGVTTENDPRYNSSELPSIDVVRKREKAQEEKRQKSIQNFIEKKKEQQAWLSNKEQNAERSAEKRKQEAAESGFDDSRSFTADKKFYEFDGLDRPRKHKTSVDDFDRPRLKTRTESEKEKESKKADWSKERDFYSQEHKDNKKVTQKLTLKDKGDKPLSFASDKKRDPQGGLEFNRKKQDDFSGRADKSEKKSEAKTRFASDSKLDGEKRFDAPKVVKAVDFESRRVKKEELDLDSRAMGKVNREQEIAFTSDKKLKTDAKPNRATRKEESIRKVAPKVKSPDELRDEQRAQRSRKAAETRADRPKRKQEDDFDRLDQMRKKAFERNKISEAKTARKKRTPKPIDPPFERSSAKKQPDPDEERLKQREQQRFSKRSEPSWEERREKSLQQRNETTSTRLETIKQERAWEEKRQQQKEERRLNKKDKYS
jgi:hypothetical protein